jgi:hypothetical protein
MVIVTAKLSKPKLIGIVAAAAAVIVLVIVLSCRSSTQELAQAAGTKLETPESRVSFLASCGYTVTQEPTRTQEVLIPKEFTEVYDQYNALQQSQGFDLTKYQGKKVMQYVYQIENYPEDNGDPVYATLLLYKNKLIGCDLSRGGTEGFLRPLLST